jgi:beta-barrel assembly-enhancing protease
MSYGYDEGGYRSAEPSRGINLRVLAGIVIAIIGIIVYMTRTQINPVTGEKQHIALNVDEEKAMGLQAAPEMAARMGGEIKPVEDNRARAVALVGRRIVENSDAARSDYADTFKFTLLNDPQTVNAFALPGGPIFITKALYEKLSTEAELAGVLSHEIGHVVGRHSAEQLAQSQLGQTLTLAFGVGASGDQRGQQAAAIAAMVNQMSQLRFSRSDESKADQLGLKYMAQAGYDPSAMLQVMEVLKGLSKGGRQPEFMLTHPLPESRITEIKETLQRDYPDGIPKNLTRGHMLPGR